MLSLFCRLYHQTPVCILRMESLPSVNRTHFCNRPLNFKQLFTKKEILHGQSYTDSFGRHLALKLLCFVAKISNYRFESNTLSRTNHRVNKGITETTLNSFRTTFLHLFFLLLRCQETCWLKGMKEKLGEEERIKRKSL